MSSNDNSDSRKRSWTEMNETASNEPTPAPPGRLSFADQRALRKFLQITDKLLRNSTPGFIDHTSELDNIVTHLQLMYIHDNSISNSRLATMIYDSASKFLDD